MKKIMFFMMFIFATMFGGVSILMVFLMNDLNEPSRIFNTGTEIEATITEFVYREDSDGTRSYFVKYSFVVDEKTYHGKTKSGITYNSAKELKEKGTIQIKYNSEFKSVETFYSGTTSYIMLLPIIIFGAVSLGFIIAIIKTILNSIKRNLILKNGVLTQATFASYNSNLTINHLPYYKINYTFLNQNNQTITNTSPSDYNFNEANYYRDIETFEIKVLGDKSSIFEKPFTQTLSENAALDKSHSELIKKLETLRKKYENNSKISEEISEDENNLIIDENAFDDEHINIENNSSFETEQTYHTLDNSYHHEHIKLEDRRNEIMCGHCAHINNIKNKRCGNCGEKLR